MPPRRKKIILLSLGFLIIFLLVCIFQIYLKKERVNVLLLGIPGANHLGSDLSDTIIIASFSPNQKDLVTISVPRDIWVTSSQTKVNALYGSGGLDLVKKEIYKILGLKINFGAVIDFKGFEKAIDFVGGLNIDIDHSFDDFKYPLPGKESDECDGDPEYKCRYEHLHFEKGPSHMDGELALKFARSRFATNSGEGTDFARSKRQQKIISSFKKEFFSKKIFLSPGTALGLLRILRENVETDFGASDIFGLLRLLACLDWDQSRVFSLDWGEENQGGLLVNPPIEEYGSWVLIPSSGDWQEVQKKLEEFLKDQSS